MEEPRRFETEYIPKTGIHVGIDPGLTGALAFIGDDGSALAWDMPTVRVGFRSEVDISAVDSWFKSNIDRILQVTVELAQTMPKQGIVSAFNYGFGFGSILTILRVRSLRFATVRPAIWKKEMLAGYPSTDKSCSIEAARRMFPFLDLGKRKDAGRAEALLIAAWGKAHS